MDEAESNLMHHVCWTWRDTRDQKNTVSEREVNDGEHISLLCIQIDWVRWLDFYFLFSFFLPAAHSALNSLSSSDVVFEFLFESFYVRFTSILSVCCRDLDENENCHFTNDKNEREKNNSVFFAPLFGHCRRSHMWFTFLYASTQSFCFVFFLSTDELDWNHSTCCLNAVHKYPNVSCCSSQRWTREKRFRCQSWTKKKRMFLYDIELSESTEHEKETSSQADCEGYDGNENATHTYGVHRWFENKWRKIVPKRRKIHCFFLVWNLYFDYFMLKVESETPASYEHILKTL